LHNTLLKTNARIWGRSEGAGFCASVAIGTKPSTVTEVLGCAAAEQDAIVMGV